MTKLRQLHWPLIMGLGALALVRPLMNITGLMDSLGKSFGPLLITALISVAWVVICVFVNVRNPLLTLIGAGVAYGIFATVLSALLSPLLTGALAGPLTNPYAIVSVLLTNALWGALAGVVALVVQQGINRVERGTKGN